MAMGNSYFDGEIVKKFIEHVAVYPSGTCVVLNTGAKAIVIKQNKGIPIRPVIRLITNSNGETIQDVQEVDLSKEMTLFIVDVEEV
jgi:hypothetical protein